MSEESGSVGQATLGSRLFAWAMATFGPKVEWRLRDRKLRLFEGLKRELGCETVVEVGMGAGPNLKLYAQHVDRVIGVDVNSAMHQYARQAAEAAGVSSKLQLLTGRAEALPLEDGSADAVIMTHVLCSVGDQQQALAEVRRILKPGGRLLFIEHVAAPEGEALHTLQRVANPLVGVLGHGCSATRHTLDAIQQAGFAAVDAESFRLQVWGPAAVVSPHIAGAAVKA